MMTPTERRLRAALEEIRALLSEDACWFTGNAAHKIADDALATKAPECGCPCHPRLASGHATACNDCDPCPSPYFHASGPLKGFGRIRREDSAAYESGEEAGP